MPTKEIAYLGPRGTYSHLVAKKWFGHGPRMLPFPTVSDICTYVAGKSHRHGIVPIENSSGGAIYETVDILLAGKPLIHIDVELSLKVNLALIGRKEEPVKALYSHFAPLEHAAGWIRKNLPGVDKRVVTSTAAAAVRAAGEMNAAAIGSRKLAAVYALDVLAYPIAADIPNVTVFYAISGTRRAPVKPAKSTLAVNLPNEPGSLCSFLEAFRNEGVNLSRLISRPIRGCPREYAFLVDLIGGKADGAVKRALREARKTAVSIRMVGSYPTHRPYTS